MNEAKDCPVSLFNQWQIEEIKKALGEADHEEFTSPKKVQRTIRKWARLRQDG